MLGRYVHLTTLFPGKVNQFFLHILFLVTDKKPSWISRREESDLINYFMINLNVSMGPSQDQTHYPWICSQISICSQTRYRLLYTALYILFEFRSGPIGCGSWTESKMFQRLVADNKKLPLARERVNIHFWSKIRPETNLSAPLVQQYNINYGLFAS